MGWNWELEGVSVEGGDVEKFGEGEVIEVKWKE